MTETILSLTSLEKKPEEQLSLNIGGIIISGIAGTGTSSLADKFKIKFADIQLIKIGEFIRRIAEENEEDTTSKIIRDVKTDHMLDKRQMEKIFTASSERPFVSDSRLGGWIANEARRHCIENNQNEPSIFTILLTGDAEKLLERVHKRQAKKYPGLSREDSDRLTNDRNNYDLSEFQKRYPDLKGINPHGIKSHNMYDLIIDTTDEKFKGDSPKEAIEKIFKYVINKLFEDGKIIAYK
ncbi:MAG: hypothetical protein EXS44_02125 [Candidatus Levybacteria bacterium]|nr:hypothetical protein [Candidatus Levybacteria bacterium]